MHELCMRARRSRGEAPTVAYVLKSFPRLSETFIASEIYRLEQLGVRLRLFVIKASDERLQHPVVDAIRAPRVHLPHAAPVSGVSLPAWLARHLPSFAAALVRVVCRHPLRTARTAVMAAAQALRARPTRWSIKKSPIKEWLQAVALADAIEMLHRQPDLAASLARVARVTIRTRFNGDVTAHALSALLREAVAC